jgi:putative DNA methylase
METLLERGIPIDAVNEYSAVEKGPGRPPHWEMVFWWTRKPLAGARAVVAASLLPAEAYQTPEQFLNDLFPCRHNRKTVHACNPASRLVEKIRGKKVLDPFAGFGSIPLEAARLGAEAVAVELLPTAYVFLKAVLEFPRRVKPQNVEKWGRWVVEKLREETRELYDADVYIGTWEVKCPVCGRHTPLVGNWWLARMKGKEGYKRLAWMEWRDGRVEVRDLNEECRKEGGGSCDELRAEVSTRGEEGEGGSVVWRGRRYAVPRKNVDVGRKKTAQCLYCRAEINHRVVNGKLVRDKKDEGDWYVKWALRQWNANYERYLRGEITLEELKNSPARPTLLVKIRVENGDLKFQPATPQDLEKLWKTLEKLRRMWGDPDIPTEPIPGYESRSIWVSAYGFDKWFKLFNSRQLLTLVKLVKLIRETGRLAEEEKLREGAGQEEAKKYAEAITTYLAIALIRYVDYNCVSTIWNYGGQLPAQVAHGLSTRGIAMTWNWGDASPHAHTSGTGTFQKNLEKLVRIVSYLRETLSQNIVSRIILDDAAELSKLEGERFDVVVTDPPYADDVPYAELTDFYYVWLKRALSNVENGELRPRFLPEAFFDEFGLEIPTQWQRFAPREVSENEGRWEHFGMRVTFADLLSRAFSNVVRFLKEDGLLVVYYVAKKPESWEALVDALWRRGGMTLVAAYPVETEAEESVVARGKASVLGGYVSAWRRRAGERPLDLDAVWEVAVGEVARRVEGRMKMLRGKNGATAWVYYYMAALEYLTAYFPVRMGGVELDSGGLLRAAVSLAFDALIRAAGVKLGDRAGYAYLALRILESERGYVDSDVLAHVERMTGMTHVELARLGLIREAETGGPRVAKRKVFEVLAPRSDAVDEVRRVYTAQRGRSPALDCLRQMQLSLLAKAPVSCSPEARQEALALARALAELAKAGILDEDDPDVKLAKAAGGLEWWQ